MAESAAPEIRIPAINLNESEGFGFIKGKSSPTGLSLPNKFMRSLSGSPGDGKRGSPTPTATDPVTQNIMERRSIDHPSPTKLWVQTPNASNDLHSEFASADSNARLSAEFKLEDGAVPKDRKSRVSFLSRFRSSSSRKRDSIDIPAYDEDPAEAGVARDEGTDAAVFSQPMGYIPKFPEPPKYIKVRSRGKSGREFDRLFLAQELRGRTGLEVAQAGGHRISVNTKMKHDNASWAMEFSKDGHYLAAGGQGHVVRVWAVLATEADRREEEKAEEAAAGQGVKLSAPVFRSRPVQEYEGHTASILAVSWSKNNFLLSSSMDKTVRLWHVSRAECLCVFKHPDFVPAVRFHPQDDRFFLAGSLDSKLRLWSIPDKNVAYSTAVGDLITAVEFTPDGKTCMAGTLSGLCMFYDTERLMEQTKMHVRSTHGKNARGSKITGIHAVNFPPNDPKGAVKLLITSNDSRIRVYNICDKSLELKLKGNENAQSQIRATFSDDGRHIICGSEDKKCYIWNMGNPDKDREKHPMEMFEAHTEIVTSAVMAPMATKQLLQASGDPVFEICNPPPVQLLPKEETKSTRSVMSSGAQSAAGHEMGPREDDTDRSRDGPAAVEPPSSFKSRSVHPGGHIIITADTEGRLKCFRSDCAHKNRLKNNESWETGSTFSKKVLQRSSSIATRASRNSATFRDSVISERVLSWRQSIDRSSLPPAQVGSADFTRSPSLRMNKGRSMSPRKSLGGLGMAAPQGRRLSSLANFAVRSDSNTATHPLSTSVTNTPVASSAGASAHSLHSDDMSSVDIKPLASTDMNGKTQVISQDDFNALGIRHKHVGGRAEKNHTVTAAEGMSGDFTSDEHSEDDSKAERCRGCGSDSFRAVRLGKGRSSRTRLECSKCSLPAD